MDRRQVAVAILTFIDVIAFVAMNPHPHYHDGGGVHHSESSSHVCPPDTCNYNGGCTVSTGNHMYHCHCYDGFTGHYCETRLTTQPPPTTTTQSTTTTIVTTAPIHYVTCGKLSTISELANQLVVENKLAAPCLSGSHSSPEAFVLNNCPLADPSNWRKGPNVLQACSNISLYTPIAQFDQSGYMSASQTISGVFLGCLNQPDGFKVAIQHCETGAVLHELVIGGQIDPRQFHVIVQ